MIKSDNSIIVVNLKNASTILLIIIISQFDLLKCYKQNNQHNYKKHFELIYIYLTDIKYFK